MRFRRRRGQKPQPCREHPRRAIPEHPDGTGSTKRVARTRRVRMGLSSWLTLVIVALTAWLGAEVVFPLFSNPEREGALPYVPLAVSVHRRSMKPYSEYERVLKARELFKPSLQIATGGIARIGIEKMVEKLSLTGIIAVGSSFQALITNSDKKEGGTGLYREGDSVAGFTVKEVGRGKVIIEYAGQLVELGR